MSEINLHTTAQTWLIAPPKKRDDAIINAAVQKLASYRLNWYGFILEFCSSLRNRITLGHFRSSAAIICDIASREFPPTGAANLGRKLANFVGAGNDALAAELGLLFPSNSKGANLVAQLLTASGIEKYTKTASFPPAYTITLKEAVSLAKPPISFSKEFAITFLQTEQGTLVQFSPGSLKVEGWDLHKMLISKENATIYAGPSGLFHTTMPIPGI